MKYKLSKAGEALAARTGILELMDDLCDALRGDGNMLLLGGGNPGRIPEAEQVWRKRMLEILNNAGEFEDLLGVYERAEGSPPFLKSIADFLNRKYGMELKPENICVTNGSQTAMFLLFKMLAGEQADGSFKKVLLPVAPEYIGYRDLGAGTDIFRSHPATVEKLSKHEFKYHPDFDTLSLGDDTSLMCVSRPTNPTGNVVTAMECDRLAKMAADAGIPIVFDCAYGEPFPGVTFTEATPPCGDNVVLSFSLSKMGLPGTRTGILVGDEGLIEAISSATAVTSLANGALGQAISSSLFENDDIGRLADTVLRPWYQDKSELARECIFKEFADDFPWMMHRSEGAFFLWLYLPELPVTDRELYERLKNRGVIVVPGYHSFYALDEDWDHASKCIRVSFAMGTEVIKKGIAIIADELRDIHANK